MKNLILNNIDKSWAPVFDKNIRNLEKIDEKLCMCEFNPEPENILRFAKNPVEDINVVIVGQDTYPAKGVATGRAFEVGGLNNWNTPFRQVSLKNIVRLLYGSYTDETSYSSFNHIKKKINNGEFKILQPNLLFSSWENQGVLLLNCALTCEVGKPGSHSEYWKPFMDDVLKFLCLQNKETIFFLWGSVAQQVLSIVDDGRKIYKSRHPMMCSKKYSDDFLKNRCFYDTKSKIDWLGGGCDEAL